MADLIIVGAFLRKNFITKLVDIYVDELALAVLGLVATIVVQIAGLAYWLGRKFAVIEERFREIDNKFKEVDERFEKLERSLREEVKRAFSIVASTATAMNALMALKGLVTERDFLRRQLESSSRIVLNPITKEEAEFIRKVFSKPEEEVTIELDKALEIRGGFLKTGKRRPTKCTYTPICIERRSTTRG